MSLPPADTAAPPRSAVRRPLGLLARVPRSTLALLAVSILLPLILFALAAAQNRHDVVVAAERRVERTTRILHEHAMKVFETHQLMLDQINERLVILDWSKPSDVAALRGLLVHLTELLPQVADISVIDAAGTVRVSSALAPGEAAPNFADRNYFRALKATPSKLPYVSRGAMGRISNTPIFTMAQRIRTATPGRFEGVVAVSIEQSYFKEFYSQAEREYSHLVILARTDGSVLASEPMLPAVVTPPRAMFRLKLDSVSRDALIRPAIVDGIRRIFGYEKVGAYPVVIGFGVTWQSALQPWWRNMRGYGLVAALSSLALLGVSWFAIRRIALEGRATERWRRSAAQLRTEMAGRARVEEQLRQSQKMEAVGRLTGGIAHDFNNLLTVVIGSLDLLGRRMKDADPRHRELVANAVDGASRAAALTQRLLAFSRQQPLDPKPLAINDLVEGMRSLLARTLRESVTIELKLEAVADRALVDPNQLENAILNLCVNAMDAMPRGGMLTVSTGEVELDAATCAAQEGLAPGAYVAVAVTDTGTGMPPDVLARAFEPFFTTKPVGKGTGLGLAQVYGFARQSGGHADIETVEDAGTTIRILLPRLSIVADNVVPLAAATAPVETRRAVAGTTILLVEDDDGVRRFGAGALRDAGYRVVEAATGADALRELSGNPDVALLFTDVVLKGSMTGRDLAEAVLLARPGLPVLYTTGYTADAIVHDGRLEEGLELLGKPFRAEALVARVATLLDARTATLAEPGRALRTAAAE